MIQQQKQASGLTKVPPRQPALHFGYFVQKSWIDAILAGRHQPVKVAEHPVGQRRIAEPFRGRTRRKGSLEVHEIPLIDHGPRAGEEGSELRRSQVLRGPSGFGW